MNELIYELSAQLAVSLEINYEKELIIKAWPDALSALQRAKELLPEVADSVDSVLRKSGTDFGEECISASTFGVES